MVAVQSEGCAPIVRAFEEGSPGARLWEQPRTFASGIRVPRAIGDFLILTAVRASHGIAVSVSEREIYDAIGEAGAAEGLFMAPEGAACWAALRKMVEAGQVQKEETVVIFNTGSGPKYLDLLQDFERNGVNGREQ